MATEVFTRKWCDTELGGDPPEKVDAAETVRFRIGTGPLVEIDLCAEHWREFMAMTGEWIANGHEVEQQPPIKVSPGAHREGRIYLAGLRAWAAEQGIQLKTYSGSNGKSQGYKYPVDLRRRYDAYLRERGEGK